LSASCLRWVCCRVRWTVSTPSRCQSESSFCGASPCACSVRGIPLPTGVDGRARHHQLLSLHVISSGVCFAVPLRQQVIVREKLRFPSGTATAAMITTLHQGVADGSEVGRRSSAPLTATSQQQQQSIDTDGLVAEDHAEELAGRSPRFAPSVTEQTADTSTSSTAAQWRSQWRVLLACFLLSGVYTVVAFFVPVRSPSSVLACHC
jgi:hypothetical protein